ncbi:hypothetical protein DP113_33295 (plasmid) [Brasilonema octagenarum UFV-E1]|uniref:Uncharacterized protein n=2 Tax=Brasilonema TaxID=383614 RepID=A0A856MMF1_9CYAN|nr:MULTISPECIES: hypothetical protein [Brasilonema]NMF61680.1 hypothetical protein [Brasilonema octagenarum UFV-OR1]QDL12615.1 hypothetical protein DP114_33190 [Brasilonema sennae CENA114]QDL19010.1 hypothetical protein DP113_33295 [Brasilonema octagenarum UFV-E1]
MTTLEIKSLTLLESKIEEGKSQKKLEYEILAKDSNLPWVASSELLKDIKELISNHPELDGLAVTSIYVYAPKFNIESTNLSKQVLDLTLSGKAEVYHEVYETEDG